MDVQKCNLVVHFDPIQQFRSYVQSKGRARAKPSKFIVMVDKGEASKWQDDLASVKKINFVFILYKQTKDERFKKNLIWEL